MKYFLAKKLRRLSFFAILLGGAAFFSPLPVKAQDVNARIARLENEMQTLSRAVFRHETPPPDAFSAGQAAAASPPAADLALRLQQVEMDLRALTGKIEEQEFQSRQFREQTETAIKDLENRLAALETTQTGAAASSPENREGRNAGKRSDGFITGGLSPDESLPPQPDAMPDMDTSSQDGEPPSGVLGTLSSSAPPPQIPNEPAAPAAENDPVGYYEYAFSLLRNRDYEKAEKAFKEFLDRYDSHDLAANAQYWLGETFYVRGDFKNATRIFAEGYQKYSKGPKGPDNLLKLGMSLAGMGKNDDACLSYRQLAKEYPSGAQAVLTRAKQEMEKLGCAGR